MPGSPTHSKITGRLGLVPSVSIVRQTCCQGTGTRWSFSIVERASSTAAGMVER